MTASPPATNGATRPRVQFADWSINPDEPVLAATPEPEPALVAEAQAEAIRAQAWAEAEQRRIAAETEKETALQLAAAEADAVRIKAEEEARKQRLANDRAERKAEEEAAASKARIAEHNRRRDDADRARAEAARQADEQKAAAEAEAAEIEEAENRWRGYARSFYIVCAIVALPVQVAAFYDPKALWLMAAPLMLEGGAWVVLKGAAAAVASGRPHWHYRLIAWLLAFIAAGINLWHGLNAFDPATAIGTAFASVAGPGVWDLHEHGRIRQRDGKPSWSERQARRKAERADMARKAAEDKQRAAEKEAADKLAASAAEALGNARADEFPKVWNEAEKIAAAVGETSVTEAVWARAYRNIQGCEPGESIESITARRAAEKRVEAALTGTPVSTLSKTTNAQRASHVPPVGKRRTYTPPARAGKRTRGDSQPFVGAARRQAAITARQATSKTQQNPN
ncbi:hypothetical protein [Streptomyces sp. NPDC101249]|uniref:hypothetical protein n=1 Tax=Streptomyces sp. NPDC101249 TaxID=3366140 RepID=UPI0038012BA8